MAQASLQARSSQYSPLGLRRSCLAVLLLSFVVGLISICGVSHVTAQGKREISEDRDVKELDLSKWDCLNKAEGSARTPDGQERNRLKNRPFTDAVPGNLPDLDIAAFVRTVSQFDSITVKTRRKDLSAGARQQLDPMEKEIVQVTGYLGVAYCGPPETTNCASVDFHDWHLELFEKPLDHPPQVGDPTPIICEISPRTQNGIYAAKIRIQDLTAFFRRADLEYESTGHPARKIHVVGYRLWDDEHNGAADIGTTVRRINPNKYHNPWRRTAWEIHPILKIIPADHTLSSPPTSTAAKPVNPSPSVPAPAATSTASPAPSPAEPVAPPEASAPPSSTPSNPGPPQFVTIVTPVKIKIPYGETMLPRGAKLPFVSRDARTVTVQYMGTKYPIPIASTDLQ